MGMKLNCWEFKKCGREPGGLKARERGACPATVNCTGLEAFDSRDFVAAESSRLQEERGVPAVQ